MTRRYQGGVGCYYNTLYSGGGLFNIVQWGGGCIGITVTTRPIIRTRAGAEPSTWKTPLECWLETELHQMIKTSAKKVTGTQGKI